ncbi:MAG: hypothetical protein FJ291_34075, partial [Planctomycetes bacterium]|nr:hypothetical protein [Planctomycetota bacterium]
NPLAQALLAAGWEVSGSDRYLDAGEDLEVLPKLRRAGVRLVPQDGSGVTAQTQAVVASTAIEADNPDLAAAARLGVPVVHRSVMLARLCEGKELIAVTGTSGKTTVTGMVGFLLEQLGDDPTVVNGGVVINWETDEAIGNVRLGRRWHRLPACEPEPSTATGKMPVPPGGCRWVLEADESDRSLLNFAPDWAIITNMSADHFPMDETIALFTAFAAKVKKGIVAPPAVWQGLRSEQALASRGMNGWSDEWMDERGTRDAGRGTAGEGRDGHQPMRPCALATPHLPLVPSATHPPIHPSIHPLLASLELSAAGCRFTYGGQEFHLPLLGRHNAENALLAVMLCERLGHPLDRIAAALGGFRGIRRRLDLAGTARAVTVIDDYAHNPAKLRAAWEAVAPYYARVLAVWRPHGFGPLAKMFDDLKALFADLGPHCERLYVLPVYYAGGTASAALTSADLVAALASAGVPAELVPDYDALIRRIAALARPGDVVLSMGARDPGLPALARRILAALAVPILDHLSPP